MVYMPCSLQLLDVHKGLVGTAHGTRADEGSDERARRAIVCASCGTQLTDASQRIEVSGQHEHTFFNPAGLVFHLVCFASAPGCCGVGPFSSEFTWFPGHRWQIAVCASCSEHLGWHFAGDSTFTALIEARIVESET